MQEQPAARSLAALLPAPWLHELSANELVQFVSSELARNALFDSEETRLKRVPQIAVFVAHCAPRAAPAAGLMLAAEFLFAFFALNDHWERAPVGWIQSWQSRVREEQGVRAQRFLDAFQCYLLSLEQEKLYEATPGHPTFEEYVDVERGRYQWVATAPYIELWELALGVDVDVAERARAEALKSLAVELTYLANDIGSLGRDPSSKNYVTLLAQREPALTTLEEAIAATARIYAEKARALVNARSSLNAQSTLGRYAETVCDIADGNLRATTLLARSSAEGRYSPLARDCLAQLPLVG